MKCGQLKHYLGIILLQILILIYPKAAFYNCNEHKDIILKTTQLIMLL